MWYAFTAQEDTPREDPCIDWLEEAIQLANELTAILVIEIAHKARFGGLAESGKAPILKIGDY